MIRYKELFIVTPLSKILSAVLFIILPILGFIIGIRYSFLFIKPDISTNQTSIVSVQKHINTPSPIVKNETGWTTYENKQHGFSIETPDYFLVRTNMDKTDESQYFLSLNTIQKPSASIFIQYNAKGPAMGINKKPITKIEDGVMYYDSKFEIQGYPAVRSKHTTANQTTLTENGSATTFHILKGDEFWSIDGRIESLKEEDQALIEQILSTFKFID